MTRKTVIAGNWKMNFTRRKASGLAREVTAVQGESAGRICIVFPPFVHLEHVRRNLKGGTVVLGAQNCHEKREGAFTGEISPVMLRDMSVKVVLLGHSERRHVFGEPDERIALKLKAVLKAKLGAMLCVGETLAERESGRTYEVLAQQLKALKMVKPGLVDQVTLAYEPVWAIGTGVTATPDQVQETHAEVRRLASDILGAPAGENLPILYGGSVNPGNAATLLAQPDVDGLLVGGASLSIETFGPILEAAPA